MTVNMSPKAYTTRRYFSDGVLDTDSGIAKV